MGSVRKRQSAKRDLIAQWVWYAENVDTKIADSFLLAVDNTLKMLSANPQCGIVFKTRHSELHGMRKFPVGDGFDKFLVFYFPLEQGIDLVRIIHGSRSAVSMFTQPTA